MFMIYSYYKKFEAYYNLKTMKKYIVAVLLIVTFLFSSPLTSLKASPAEMSVRDFINLLITIGVIPQDKVAAVNLWLRSLDMPTPTPARGGGGGSGSSSNSRGSSSSGSSASQVSAPVPVSDVVAAVPVSELILDSKTTSWQGSSILVPNAPSFLDLSFSEIGNCPNSSYSIATVYINDSLVDKQVRYREIQKGEKVNFHIDLNSFQGQTIYPKIVFNNGRAGSCFKLRIDRNELKSRDTLFPDWVVTTKNKLKADFLDTKNKGLGLNDMGFDSKDNTTAIDAEKISLTAKKLGAKSFRQWPSPSINFTNCKENDFHSCFDSTELNTSDGFYESLVDRGIAPVQIITTPTFKSVSENEKANFLSIFKYKNSRYVDSSNWVCPSSGTQNLNGSGSFVHSYSRFDLSSWYQYSIPEMLVNRYKNGVPALDVGNEFNIGPHLYSCTPSGLNSIEINDMFSVYSDFTKKFCSLANSNRQTSIFGGYAYVANNGGGGLATMRIDDTLRRMTPGSFSSCDFISIHNYTGSQMTKDHYFSTLSDALEQVKSTWNKGIIISEFGYGSGTVPPTNSGFTNIISEVGHYIKSSADILTAQYYLVLRRDWMQNYSYWADYGSTAMLDRNHLPNEPFYSQFKNSNLEPTPRVCTSFNYSQWSPTSCPTSGQQTRAVLGSSPAGCVGGSPVTSQSCNYAPEPKTCTSFEYSDWSSCSVSGTQTRKVSESSPSGCTGGSPVTTQKCACVDGKFWALDYNGDKSRTDVWYSDQGSYWWYYGNGWRGRDVQCSW